jgi:hypothetical protein
MVSSPTKHYACVGMLLLMHVATLQELKDRGTAGVGMDRNGEIIDNSLALDEEDDEPQFTIS